MANYQVFHNEFYSRTEKFKEFYRYRKSAFYYFAIFCVILLLAVNFLNYEPESDFNPPEVKLDSQPRDIISEQKLGVKLPFTTTPSPSLIPYNYEELPPCDLTRDSPNPIHNAEAIANEFSKCASMILLRFAMNPVGMLYNWPYTTYVCDEEDLTSKIPVRSFDNGEKQYWAILPTCRENTTLVTLGVSQNTKSEDEIRSLVKDFVSIGTDPFHSRNRAYDQFHQIALSSSDDQIQIPDFYDKDSSSSYVPTMYQKGFFTIVSEGAPKKIDMLWITPNSGNFEYQKYLVLEGEFLKMGITVCQVNIEIKKEDAHRWADLINPLVAEKQFIFMRPMHVDDGDLTRTFLLNVNNTECVRKYLQ